MGIPANPIAAPFEVVPMMTYKKKNVAMTWINAQCAREALSPAGLGAIIWAAVDTEIVK
jgi:hypothetical protein